MFEIGAHREVFLGEPDNQKKTDTKPARRVHPYTFSIIYACISVLALTENGVLNSVVVTMALAQAHAVSMLYMQIVWYWAGKMEKLTHEKPAKQSFDQNGGPVFGASTTNAAAP